MAGIIVLVIIAVVAVHVLGGAHHHAKLRRRGGLRPSLRYTYGYGWWGSLRLPGGFRLGHRL